MKYLIDAFATIGGWAALARLVQNEVPTLLAKYVPGAVDIAIRGALKNQKMKPVIIALRPDIEAFFSQVDKEVAKDLDAASQHESEK